MKNLSLKQRILWVVGLWVAGLVLGTLMFFLTDAKDADYYLLSIWLFPSGLLAPLMGWLDEGLPKPTLWVLWGLYLGASGWLVSRKGSRIFWYGFAGLAVVVLLNIGGCSYVIHH